MQIKEHMKKGYREMGAINLALSEMGLDIDLGVLKNYEARLAECE